MTSFQKATSFFLLLHGGADIVQSKSIDAIPADGVFILKDESTSDMIYHGLVTIESNVPVTIHRYYDDLVEGSQAVQSNEAKVMLTSDCAGTTLVPYLSMGPDSIRVGVWGAFGGMPFLDSSSYEAEWDYESYWCRHFQRNTYPPTPAPPNREAGPAFTLESILPSSILDMFTKSMGAREPEGEPEEGQTARALSTNVCNVNVEVLIDGCSHDLDVSAPAIRVLDSNLENFLANTNAEDECITDYEADIVFPGPPSLEGAAILNVPTLDCSRPVPGRPFVDSTGSALRALPLVAPSVAGVPGTWSADDAEPMAGESYPSAANNTIGRNQLLLGEEWTKSALGEHASVASFAAFSVALMTNGAPSDLVQDALEAALDEVRHAETSFEIASELTGRNIEPGPLPSSEHSFEQDLRGLALAVAREGCVDETLSALEVAAEVDLIDAALEAGAAAGATKYAGIDAAILAWIGEELRTIALEEASHSALAWRTVRWACSVSPDACNAVEEGILNEHDLDGSFRQRFKSVGAGEAVLMMAWKDIYSRGVSGAREDCSDDYDSVSDSSNGSFVSIVAGKVISSFSVQSMG